MQDLDHSLFLALNFDGGPLCDRLMLALSGIAMWVPLYALILWLVWRREGWRGTLLFLLLVAAAVGVADMVAGIFKHSGLLGGGILALGGAVAQGGQRAHGLRGLLPAAQGNGVQPGMQLRSAGFSKRRG